MPGALWLLMADQLRPPGEGFLTGSGPELTGTCPWCGNAALFQLQMQLVVEPPVVNEHTLQAKMEEVHRCVACRQHIFRYFEGYRPHASAPWQFVKLLGQFPLPGQ